MENLNVHAWVADGYKIEKKRKTYRNEKGYYFYGSKRNKSVYDDTFYLTNEYLHMNWGLSYNYYKVEYKNEKDVLIYSEQEKNDGWCTYDYWVCHFSNDDDERRSYNENKKMITIRKN